MNREDLGELKNLYENVIYEAPLGLGSAQERTQQQLELSRARAEAARAANAARAAAIAQRKAPGNETPGYSGPPTPGTTTAVEKPSVPTKVTPAKPGMSSPANATTAQKISGGMKVYDAQRKAGDLKGAAETGKNISSLQFGSPEERKAKTIGTRNPLMDKTFGYPTGNAPDQIARASQGVSQATSNAAFARSSETANRMGLQVTARNLAGINNIKPKPEMKEQSQEWPSAKTIRDIADAYASIYEAKKNDGNLANNYPPYDKVTRGDVIAGRLGKDEMGGKKKSTKKEDFEFWINNLLDEGYDLSDYTWDDMYEIYEQQLDEATRMRKELGKEGETRVRGELAARSRAYQRSGSIDRTIAGAEAAADRITPRGRNESPGEYKQRMQKRSRTLRGLAASRRGSVRDKPRAGMRGYAAKVEGPDKELQTARQKAMSAGTLTPKEKKELGEEYQIYEIVASYLLENNFAETINDANVIIENMSEVWLEEILNNN